MSLGLPSVCFTLLVSLRYLDEVFRVILCFIKLSLDLNLSDDVALNLY